MKNLEPYKVLFPIGLFYSLIGVFLWAIFPLTNWQYPSTTHANFMYNGFLLTITSGFLITALPKFTASNSASLNELSAFILVALAPLFTSHPIQNLLYFILLFIFYFSRTRKAETKLSENFFFINIGITWGLFGSILLLAQEFDLVVNIHSINIKKMLYQFSLECFIVGIGSRIFSAVLSRPSLYNTVEFKKPSFLKRKKSAWARMKEKLQSIHFTYYQAALMTLGQVLQVLEMSLLGRVLFFLSLVWISFYQWKLHQLPKSTWTTHAKSLYVTLWINLCIYAYRVIHHTFDPHADHALYIVTFSLIILLVSSRVIHSHGGYELQRYENSQIYYWITALVTLSMLTRTTALLTQSIFEHFAYAAILWLVALILWCIYHLKKIFNNL